MQTSSSDKPIRFVLKNLCAQEKRERKIKANRRHIEARRSRKAKEKASCAQAGDEMVRVSDKPARAKTECARERARRRRGRLRIRRLAELNRIVNERVSLIYQDVIASLPNMYFVNGRVMRWMSSQDSDRLRQINQLPMRIGKLMAQLTKRASPAK